MRYLTCPPAQAIGQIARANISNAEGQRIIAKGHRLTAYDVERCVRAGIVLVDIVITESTEVDENAAAQHIAQCCIGPGVRLAAAHHGRADIHADCDGVLRIDTSALQEFNLLPTQTLATILDGTVVQKGQRVASVKILPFAVPESDLPQQHIHVVRVLPFVRTHVGVLIVGAPATHPRIQQTHLAPLLERIERFGAVITSTVLCIPEQAVIVNALALLSKECNIVISLSETSVMGIDESIPRSLVAAGGSVIRHGAPVEPGNMMLLGNLHGIPFLAAPGCIRNRARNVVDLLLPRLIADDVPTARDIAGWAHGGLLRGNDD
jgi:molybdopterin biosynthesis enzyme